MEQADKVRVRFAPSPTGPLHIGGVRTALYNYLFAKKHGGDFLLRIEDTDQGRFVPGAEQYIMESLRWCGLNWDEGPDKGGEFAPYRQSERKDLYKKYALQLIESGNAYYAFDTPEEIEQMRKKAETEKSNAQYDANTRMSMNNSLTMTPKELELKLSMDVPYVIRYKMPENKEIILNDLVRGQIKVNSSTLDDKVLYKSDGLPTYHMANVVDDHAMEISHVIRGEEWLPSLPLHVMLYRSLGWKNQVPEFAHLPLLLKPDGNGKLSKRDGDRLGFPVFPLKWSDPKTNEVSSSYRESGYLPEAFVNMLAFLGWNPGTDQELFTLDEMIKEFSLDRIVKSGARFNQEKAVWYNHQYLQKLDTNTLSEMFEPMLKDKGIVISRDKLNDMVGLVSERVNFIHELWDQLSFFFEAPTEYDEKTIKKKWKQDTSEILKNAMKALDKTDPFESSAIDKTLHDFMEESGVGAGKLMIALRISFVGAGKGPDLKKIMEILGKEETFKRIETAITKLG